MKNPLVALVLLAFALHATAQGTVHFDNRSSTLTSPPDRLVRFDPVTVGTNVPNPYGTNNAPVVNSDATSYRAQLYYGASTSAEGALVPVSTAPTLFYRWTNTNIEPGTWASGNRTLDGFPLGATVNLQVRVWDSNATGGVTSYEEALAIGNGLFGKSLVFSYIIPDFPIGPDPWAMRNFQGFTIGPVPEPSGIIWIGIGASVLAWFRHRHSKVRNSEHF